jgi:membrane fusion protein, adhesin transport system
MPRRPGELRPVVPATAPAVPAPARRPSRDDAPFMSDVDAIEHQGPRLFAHLLLLSVALFFVVFVAWASWAALEEVTRGEGRVIPSRQIQVVQNLEGGILAELRAREGEIVEVGQVLLRIDNVRAASDYREQKGRYLALLATLARLRAEIDEAAVAFPPEVLAEARDQAESEIELFNARQAQLDSELEILRRQAEQREQELAELRSADAQLERSWRLAAEELRITEPLAQQRVVPRIQLLQLQRQVNDLRGELDQTRLKIPRVESALREANKRIEESVLRFRSEALRELSALQAELAGLREVVGAGEDRVLRTDVRSPVRGTVNKIVVQTLGGVIQPGQDLVEIVPLEDTLLVEARVRPADIAFLRPDQQAMVKITAYDFAIYGGLEGQVESISADTIADERGESFYRVRIRTDRNHLGREDDPLHIIPGMTAQVDILTGEKTVLDYLLKPILRARDHALRER